MKHLPPIMAIFSFVVLLLGGYVTAYLMLGTYEAVLDRVSPNSLERVYAHERVYGHEWLPPLFKPAAAVESALCGETVTVAYRSPLIIH